MQKVERSFVKAGGVKSAGVGVYQNLHAKQAFRHLMYVQGDIGDSTGDSCVSEGESTRARVTFEMHACR